jgi:hypothetical protein
LAEERIYQGDVGVLFKIDTGVDLTLATTIELHVKKPDGTEDTWDATMDTTVKTHANYTSVALDLDQVGTYALYAYVEFTASSKHSGMTTKFRVWGEYQ